MKYRILILLFVCYAYAGAIAQELTTSVVYSLDNHNGGTIAIEQVAEQTFSILATPNSGYEFKSWIDGSTTNPRTYTHTEDEDHDRTFYAIFTKTEDLNPNGGIVAVNITNVNQPQFELIATAFENFEFFKWNNGYDQNVISYEEQDGTRIPLFGSTINQTVFSIDDHIGGHIEASVISGNECSVSAIANEGYEFKFWSDNNQSPTRAFTYAGDATHDQTLYAVFAKKSDIHFPEGEVAVSLDDATIPSFTLTETPSDDYTFFRWNNGQPTTYVSYEEKEGTRIPYFYYSNDGLAYELTQHPGGVVSIENLVGMSCNIRATANEGYQFMSWADGITTNPRSYVHTIGIDDSKTLHAVFTKMEDLTQDGGVVNVSISNADFPSFSLFADAGECSELFKWNNGGVTNPMPYIEADGTRFPYFSHGDFTLEPENNDGPGGTIIVTPLVCGFKLEPLENAGYSFSHWEDNSTVRERQVDYVADTYTAYFGASVAKINQTYYSTLADAVQHADEGAIELIENTTEEMIVDKPITLQGSGKSIGNLNILCGGSVTMTGAMTVNDLILNTTTGSSAQLINPEQLDYAHAYLDITLEANKSQADPNKWYGICSPFDIDVASGISRVEGSSSHISGTDYLLWEYDGDLRANTGNGWKKILEGTMHAGRFYMIGIEGTQNIWRFAKKEGANLCGNDEIDLDVFPSNDIDKGWNAIGNSMLQYVKASIDGIPFVQVYDNINSRYLVKLTEITSFVVGCPFFVQADGENTMYLTSSDATANLYAPVRCQSNSIERDLFEVRFGNEDIYDAIFVSASEDATYQYEVGRDLIKMGINSALPTLWTSDYGQMLCVQEAPLENNQAYFALSLSAPKSGIYTLDMTSYSDNANLYLTQNGCVIWNLGMAPYDIDLDRGVNMEYGLLLNKKSSVTTDWETTLNGDNSVCKFIKDSRLYILRNHILYDALGNKK